MIGTWICSQGPQCAVSCTHAAIRQAVFFLGMLYILQMTQAQELRCLQSLAPSPNLTYFVQPLPLPSVIDVSTGAQLTLGAYKISQSVHPELPNTTFYGYGTNEATATYPGPTLEAKRDVDSFVRFENHITDAEHIFAVDRTLHLADPPNGGVPIVTHLHGAEAESKYDGHPEAWYTASGDTGPTFVTRNNTYPNQQPAALLWYHDHTIGWTRLNVAAGLAGLYIIRGGSEEPADLPQGEYEVPLVIQDRQFFDNGSIAFPSVGRDPNVHPSWCPDYLGDTILVNGKAWPYLNVTRNVYRFRILNGANARLFTLSFSDSRVKFVQIGTDGGYLWDTQEFTDLTIPPAYRVDVLVDFRDVALGTVLQLNNSYTYDNAPNIPHVMQFNVVAGSTNGTVKVPEHIAPRPEVDSLISKATVTRNMTLELGNGFTFLLNGRHWADNVTETPVLDTVEIWNIIHTIPRGIHPTHLHLVNFLVAQEQAFNLTRYTGGDCTLDRPYPEEGSCFTQGTQPLDPLHIGWKDTVLVRAGTVLKLVVPISPRVSSVYPFDASTFPGYAWHCHILDHEDNDMMRPLQFLRP